VSAEPQAHLSNSSSRNDLEGFPSQEKRKAKSDWEIFRENGICTRRAARMVSPLVVQTTDRTIPSAEFSPPPRAFGLAWPCAHFLLGGNLSMNSRLRRWADFAANGQPPGPFPWLRAANTILYSRRIPSAWGPRPTTIGPIECLFLEGRKFGPTFAGSCLGTPTPRTRGELQFTPKSPEPPELSPVQFAIQLRGREEESKTNPFFSFLLGRRGPTDCFDAL